MKKKVLCLHGYAMTKDWLAEWLAPIEDALADKVSFIYLQGPIECPEEEVRTIVTQFQVAMPESRIGPGLNWCWYRATNDKPPSYLGLDDSLNWIKQYCQNNGPIDGVLGWSQGAVMAAIMAAYQQNVPDYDFGFDWAVLCGGFLPGDPALKLQFELPLAMPSLHVVGKKESEFMLQRASRLHEAFQSGEWLETPVAHVMPINHPDYMMKIADWIARKVG